MQFQKLNEIETYYPKPLKFEMDWSNWQEQEISLGMNVLNKELTFPLVSLSPESGELAIWPLIFTEYSITHL